jgi:hypothetical protein
VEQQNNGVGQTESIVTKEYFVKTEIFTQPVLYENRGFKNLILSGFQPVRILSLMV